MKTKVGLVASLFAAATSFASFGSVISSFAATRAPYGVYRDQSYVYVVGSGSNRNYLQSYTAAGLFINEVGLTGYTEFGEMEPCHLGANYIAILGGHSNAIYFVVKSTGSTVLSYYAPGPGGEYATTLAWSGLYYYVSTSNARGEFRRYTSAGSFVGPWLAPGWPAAMTGTRGTTFAHRALGRAGDYLVCSGYLSGQPTVILEAGNGAFVGSWVPGNHLFDGACYGDSSQPATYGAAYWVSNTPTHLIYEFDVGAAGGNAVVPASIGQIKAMYR